MVSPLHRDALGSVRAVTGGAGLKAERALYRAFGEEASTRFDLSVAMETKGFIGERYDADAGLQYLNARYYDPKLGLFLQPDWWEVTWAGVGTNRYSYSFNDPVGASDPSGNLASGCSMCSVADPGGYAAGKYPTSGGSLGTAKPEAGSTTTGSNTRGGPATGSGGSHDDRSDGDGGSTWCGSTCQGLANGAALLQKSCDLRIHLANPVG